MDEINFLFAANKNQTLRNVADVASGGEVARLMLCLKSLLAEHRSLPTLIFDEIDTGVSGEVASQMALIMRNMAQYMQVMAITHLPQIAAKGNVHYKVYKQDADEHTETQIKRLTQEERVVEIAQVLSGKNVSEAALQNARELLQE
jgi:DNA repair protein RecN (Recombination protein N)